MSQRTEYLVRWQREGRRETFKILQGWGSAYQKARSVLAADVLAHDSSYRQQCCDAGKEPLPRLVSGPVIEERQVGAWGETSLEIQPPADYVVQEIAWRMGVDYGPAEDRDVPSAFASAVIGAAEGRAITPEGS